MKTSKVILAIILIATTTAATASAAGFAEKFKRFVLGSEALAHTAPPANPDLDILAQNCLDCHNGSDANHIQTRSAGSPYLAKGFKSLNHPVGMVYDDHARKSKKFMPRAGLNPNIRFVDGKVTCTSCHKLQETTAEDIMVAGVQRERWTKCTASKELTVGPKTMDLCSACHAGI